MSENNPEYFAAYEEHSKTLRTWFVAYGIGGPLLLLSNENLWIKLVESKCEGKVALLFLVGVAIQVALAVLNKALMWALYFGETSTPFKASKRYRFSFWLSKQFWIDVIADLFTIAAFVWATYLMILVILTPAP